MEDEDYTADPSDSARRTINTNLSAVIDLAAAFFRTCNRAPKPRL